MRTIALALLAVGSVGGLPAHAQAPPPFCPAGTTPCNEVHTLAAPTTGVPIEQTFDIPTAGTYQVTLTDLGASLTPSAPLASVTLAVTSGDAIVGTPLVGAGTLTLSSIPAGTYELHVVGMPGNVPGSGPIGIVVTASNMTQVAAFEDIIALPSQALPNGESVLDDSLTVATSGSYTVALNDLQLPQSLTTLTLLLIAQGGTTPVVTLPSSGAYQATVSLTAGVTYDILAVGQANSAANAGLYSAVVTGSGGAVVYGRAVPVGNTMHLGSPTLAAGSCTLSLADLKFPAALTQLGATLLLNGEPVAQLGAAGSQPFTAVANTYEAYAVGTAAAAAPGTGSYAVQVTPQGGTPSFSVGRAVTAAGSALSAYAFDTTLAAAGAETVSLADFQFPATLSSVSLAAVQGGALLGTPLDQTGTLNITAAKGPLSLVVFAQAGTSGGLFGIDVAAGTASPVFEITQAVGALFNAQQVIIPTGGNYSVTATDLGFPASFANYATIVTQGSAAVGSIYGGGTFNFAATPGTYFVNFIAQPTGPDAAGTYALTVAAAPPAPVLTLSVDHPQVSSGSTVDLIWSSQNATSCTASGGWSGTQALSGTATSAALTESTTFTLACTGAGGTVSKSVAVTIAPASGGGGSLDLPLLLLLAVALAWRVAPARKRAVTLVLTNDRPGRPRAACRNNNNGEASHAQAGVVDGLDAGAAHGGSACPDAEPAD